MGRLVSKLSQIQILRAEVALGVFDALGETQPTDAESVARTLGVDSALLYRLL